MAIKIKLPQGPAVSSCDVLAKCILGVAASFVPRFSGVDLLS